MHRRCGGAPSRGDPRVGYTRAPAVTPGRRPGATPLLPCISRRATEDAADASIQGVKGSVPRRH